MEDKCLQVQLCRKKTKMIGDLQDSIKAIHTALFGEITNPKAEPTGQAALAQINKVVDENSELKNRIDWAMRVNRSGMVGFVGDMLVGEYTKTLNISLGTYTLKEYIEATEREDREAEETPPDEWCDECKCPRKYCGHGS